MHAVSLTPHARCIWCHWHRMHGACGVIDAACTVHAVSLTPHTHVHAVSLIPHAPCMRCWHRMHKNLFEQLQKGKIICKTAMVCKKIKNTCGVNDTACTVHAVSLILHARWMRCHWHSRKSRDSVPLKVRISKNYWKKCFARSNFNINIDFLVPFLLGSRSGLRPGSRSGLS
jgi:hypothetical protein